MALDKQKIGEYVHYHLYMYKQFGIQRPDGKKQRSHGLGYAQAESIFKLQKNHILSMARNRTTSKENIDSINKTLSVFINGRKNNIKFSTEDQKIFDEVIDAWCEEIKEELGEAFDTNRITENFQVEKKSYSSRSSRRDIEETKRGHFASTIQKDIMLMETMLNDIEKNISDNKGLVKYKELQQEVKNLENLSIRFRNNFIDWTKENKRLEKSLKGTRWGFITNDKTIDNLTYEDFVTSVNVCKRLVRQFTKNDTSRATGFVAEVAAKKLAGLAQLEILKDVSNPIVAGEIIGNNIYATPVIYNSDFFEQNFLKDLNQKTVIEGDGGIYSVSLPTQNKVDVIFAMENNDTVTTTIKNHNFYSGYDISLVKESPLLAMIQDEDPVFVNHYLNMVVPHKDENTKYKSIAMGAAANAMRYTLIYKSLVGAKLNASRADVMIIIDNATGTPYVFDVAKIFTNIDAILNLFSITESSSLRNTRVGTVSNRQLADKRISDILVSAHQDKITIAMSPTVVNHIK